MNKEEHVAVKARAEWEKAVKSIQRLNPRVVRTFKEAIEAAVDDYRYRLKRSETANLPDYSPNERALVAKKVDELEEFLKQLDAYFGQEE